MATTIDTLITEYKLNSTDYDRGTASVVRGTDKVASAVGAVMPLLTMFATAVGAAGVALVALGVASSKKAAEFDAMVKALEAVVGSAEDAKRALEELHKIAAMPGLGLEEALKGYTSLRRAGMSDEMAMRTINSAGNANALASGGRAELEQILRAISQIAMKPNLSGEELMQLNEAGVPASKIIQEKFGTFDGGELKKLGVDSQQALEALVEGLEKMPKAAGSAKNSMENLQMAIDMAMVGIGMGLNNSFMPVLDNLATSLDSLASSGFFEIVGQKLADLASVVFPELATSSEELEDILIEITGAILDAAAAFMNLKFLIDQIIKVGKELPSVKITDWIMGFFKDDSVKSPSQQAKEEHDQRNFRPDVSKKRDEERKAAAEERAKKDAEDKAKADLEVQAKKELEDQNKQTQDYLKAQLSLQTRMANALETIVSSQVGGTSYGEAALAPVNFSGGAMKQAIRNEVMSFIGGVAARTYTDLGRRRG